MLTIGQLAAYAGVTVRAVRLIDPFGHRWAVDQHLKDVPHEEVVRLAAEAFGG